MSPELRAALEQRLGTRVRGAKRLGGGDINDAFEISCEGGTSLFVKTQRSPPSGMFEAEARGLRWLGDAGVIRVPRVIEVSDARPAYLALELLTPARPRPDFDEVLGDSLGGNVMPKYLAVHILFADSTRDQLRVLRAEVDD